MLRKLGFFAVLVMLIAATYAAAAGLTVDGATIQAGQDFTLYCDNDGIQVGGWGLETQDNSVRSVRLTGIDAKCNGNEINVFIEGPDKFYRKTLTAEAQQSVPFSPYLTPEEINGIKIWIEGESDY